MNKIKESFKTRKFKSGSYSAGITVVAIAIVIVINMIARALPANLTKIDLSYNQMYTLTDITKDFIKGLQEDITVYVMVSTGSEDADVMETLAKYQALSSRIKVETVDPVLHPNFATQYTDTAITEGSLLVVSAKRTKVVSAADMYERQLNTSTYSYDITGFDAEGQITSAINYVITDELPVIYTLEGHGEMAVSESLSALISKNSMELQALNLAMAEGVPEDAACVMVNVPATDINAEEAQKLLTYLEQGGTAFVAGPANDKEMSNLNSVLEYYGITALPGYAMENNSGNYFYPYPYYLAPNKLSHEITNSLISTKGNVFMPYSGAIKVLSDARSSVTITPILQTSNNSFLRTLANADSTSLAKVDGDIDGPITVGTVVSEAHGDVETKIVVYASSYITTDAADEQVNGNNYQLVTNSFSWLCGMDSSIAIPVKTFSIESLQVTSQDVNRWIIVTVVLIPLTTLVVGFVVWFRRRRK